MAGGPPAAAAYGTGDTGVARVGVHGGCTRGGYTRAPMPCTPRTLVRGVPLTSDYGPRSLGTRSGLGLWPRPYLIPTYFTSYLGP